MRGTKNPHAWQKAAGDLGTNSLSPHHKASETNSLTSSIIIPSPLLLSMWHKRQLRKKAMLATSPSGKVRYTKMVQRSFICSWGFMEGAHGSVRCRKHGAAVGLRDGMFSPEKMLLDGPKRDPISPQRVGARGQSWSWPPLQEPKALHEDHQVRHQVPWQQTNPEQTRGRSGIPSYYLYVTEHSRRPLLPGAKGAESEEKTPSCKPTILVEQEQC